MLTNKMKRAGIVLSVVWTFIGGYFLYLQNSNQDFWRSVRNICAIDAKSCAEMTDMAKGKFATDWTSITVYVALGILAIWVTLYLVAWIQRGNVER